MGTKSKSGGGTDQNLQMDRRPVHKTRISDDLQSELFLGSNYAQLFEGFGSYMMFYSGCRWPLGYRSRSLLS
jgi:hypothetical protein